MKAPKKGAPAPAAAAPPVRVNALSRPLLAGLALCVLTMLAFSNSFSTGFPLDNKGLILQDTRVHEATSQNLDLIWEHSYWWPRANSGLYRPVTTLSYLFNYATLGDGANPAGYHWINLLLHLINVLLVLTMAWKLMGEFWPAVFLAGLWAVHPVLTESVTNIVGRADLLAGMAILAGLLIYMKSAEAAGAVRVVWLLALAAVAAAGVFSKESAVMLAGAIVWYELTWWRDRRAALILGLVAVLVPVQALLYRRSFVFAVEPSVVFPFTDNPLVGAGFLQAKLTALKVIARFLGLTLFPLHLSADYSYNQIPLAHGSAGDVISWCVVAAAVAGIALLYRRNRTAFFLGGFALLMLLPTSNLLFPIGTVMAERFLYLPSIGILGCLAAGIFAVGNRFGRPWLAPALLGVLIGGFALRTWARNADWQDELSLARSAVQASPDSFKSHQMLAEALYAADDSHANVGAVLEETRKALDILQPLPDAESSAEIYRLAGDCYLLQGDRLQMAAGATPSGAAKESFQKALPALQRGIAILESAREQARRKMQDEGKSTKLMAGSTNDDLYRLLSVAWLRLGDGDKAFEAAIQARGHDPMNPAVYSQLGQVLFATGQPVDAATALMEGMLVTSDMGLRRQLLDLYGSFDKNGCAIMAGPNGPAMNPSCDLVHRNLCEASVDAVRIRLMTGRKDIATALKRSSLNDYKCPAEPLNQVLPDSGGSN